MRFKEEDDVVAGAPEGAPVGAPVGAPEGAEVLLGIPEGFDMLDEEEKPESKTKIQRC